jgi:hypothetical protein
MVPALRNIEYINFFRDVSSRKFKIPLKPLLYQEYK